MDIDSYFEDKDLIVKQLYSHLIQTLDNQKMDYELRLNDNNIHIVKGKGAFLGLHFFKSFMRINIVLDHSIKHKDLYRSDRVSKNRFHNEITIKNIDNSNDEVIGLINEAYKLKAIDE